MAETFNLIEDDSFADQATWDLICSGKTKGVFQLESNLGKSWAKRVKPRDIEELAALLSIIRPGTLKAIQDGKSMTQRFVDRKNGSEKITYPHSSLEPILKTTQGVLVYQEQSMQIAQMLAGFDLQEADNLRKAIGKKKADLMAKVKKAFLAGAIKEGIVDKDTAEEIFSWIEKSSRYAFNKSHAVSYAVCAYWSAFCKAHHQLEFYCNYLIYSSGKPDPHQEVRELVNDAKNNEIYISPPSIKSLNVKTDIIDGRIHFGMSNVKSIGVKHIEKFKSVIKEVEEKINKPFIEWSWYDFLVLASQKVNRPVVIALCSIGFFSHLPETRTEMLDRFHTWSQLTKKEQEWAVENHSKFTCIEKILSKMVPVKKEGGATFNKKRSDMLRDLLNEMQNPSSPMSDSRRWVIQEEERYLGVALTYSRIEACNTNLANTTIKEFLDGKRGDIKMAVTISDVKKWVTKNGKMKGSEMAFLCVEDTTGTLDTVTVFSQQWEENKGILYTGNNVIISGTSSKDKRRQIDDGFIVNSVIELS